MNMSLKSISELPSARIASKLGGSFGGCPQAVPNRICDAFEQSSPDQTSVDASSGVFRVQRVGQASRLMSQRIVHC